EAYIANVEQLAKLKQKHDENKAHVRLHCFGFDFPSAKLGKMQSKSLEGFEKMYSLKSVDNCTASDKIHCVTSQLMEKARKYDPSGYFLTEDIFHIDLRNPSETYCSKPVKFMELKI
ncbi:unnamed protein product, partial [Eruca vesicaria subsp. sativa]|nr:unnamed protein product [Eruca vesicaria subsp. sativa]